MAKHTGQPLDRIERDVERDFIMNSQQAKEYGIVDEIIDRPRTYTRRRSSRRTRKGGEGWDSLKKDGN